MPGEGNDTSCKVRTVKNFLTGQTWTAGLFTPGKNTLDAQTHFGALRLPEHPVLIYTQW
jgi:hypothetical protein